MDELSKRKPTRLKDFDYSSNNIYFITVCSKDMKAVFGKIVGFGVPDEFNHFFIYRCIETIYK